MALVQVATNTVTSAVASVTLTGIDSSDVYMVAYNNVVPATDSNYLYARFTESGTPNSTSNYDLADKDLRASEAFEMILTKTLVLLTLVLLLVMIQEKKQVQLCTYIMLTIVQNILFAVLKIIIWLVHQNLEVKQVVQFLHKQVQ